MGKKKKKTASEPSTCWICCEGAEDGSPLLVAGCACRGSAGLAHVACVVAAAGHDISLWTHCPTCNQEFTGDMDVALARARWETVCGRPDDDGERLFVANNLAHSLSESVGDMEGARRLFEEVLAARRRSLGDMHPDTLASITNLSLQYNEMGDHQAALPLGIEAVDSTRRVLGEEHEHTLVAAACLASVYNGLCRYADALPLHEATLEARRRTLGTSHLETMNSVSGARSSLHPNPSPSAEAHPRHQSPRDDELGEWCQI
jgi:hypothetical protein